MGPFYYLGTKDGEMGENPQLSRLEFVCIVWFTFEYILRFIGAPQKCAFIKDGMNIIDVLAILPFFVSILLIDIIRPEKGLKEVKMVVQIFKVMRILRIFKLARHSKGLQAMIMTLQNSRNELGNTS